MMADRSPEQEMIFELMKVAGDLVHSIQSRQDLIFDKTFDKSAIYKLSELAEAARGMIGPHEIWDLTNDEKYAESLKNAILGRWDNVYDE